MKTLRPVINFCALILLGLMLIAPSFRTFIWMFLPLIPYALYCLRDRLKSFVVWGIPALCLWALVAELAMSRDLATFKQLMGYWVPQTAVYLFALAALRDITAKSLVVFLVVCSAVLTAMLAAEIAGVNFHELLPSYKQANPDFGGGGPGVEIVTYKNDALRLRAFYGESSTLSAAVVVLASALFVAWSACRKPGKLDLLGIVVLSQLLIFGGLMASILSKAGISVLLGGGLGWAIGQALRGLRRPVVLFSAVAVLIVLPVAGVILYAAGPESFRAYAEDETENILEAIGGNVARTRMTGTSSRVDHWWLTLQVMQAYPLGSGYQGILIAYDHPTLFTPNPEMDLRIPERILGLMNTWANLGAQTGIVGWAVFLCLLGSIVRVGKKRRQLHWAWLLAVEIFVFWLVVETFYFLLLVPLAFAVLRAFPPVQPMLRKVSSGGRSLAHPLGSRRAMNAGGEQKEEPKITGFVGSSANEI